LRRAGAGSEGWIYDVDVERHVNGLAF
jgi:hypothetical protein